MKNNLLNNLDDEKRKRIINACIEEFANKGYDNASTNSIVEKANISKGLLFYYFGNKKNLFLYTFDYCIEYLLNKYFNEMNYKTEDLFERLIWLSLQKMKMICEEPLMVKMLSTAIINMPKALDKELSQRYNELYTKNISSILKNIDTSKFRKDIETKKAIEFIMLCIDGLSNKYMNIYKSRPIDELLNDIEKLMDEFKIYIEIIKYGIYA